MARQPKDQDAPMMDADTLAEGQDTRSRLLIHACADETRWSVPVLWRRMLARVRGAPPADRAPPTLEIHDLPGRRLLTLTNAGAPLIDMVLPTGTYHVTALTGENRRSYTVVLAQDATTELHLLPAHSRRH
jgi:hypothetical protein